MFPPRLNADNVFAAAGVELPAAGVSAFLPPNNPPPKRPPAGCPDVAAVVAVTGAAVSVGLGAELKKPAAGAVPTEICQ